MCTPNCVHRADSCVTERLQLMVPSNMQPILLAESELVITVLPEAKTEY